MYSKKGTQGENFYKDEWIEVFRYTPYRLDNRRRAEESYATNKILPFPIHVIIEVSSLCNLKCGFCNREVMARPKMNMSMETFKKVVDECAENFVHSLSLYCLGEPLMNPNLREMIIYAKGKGIPYVDVSTNGMFPLEKIVGTGLNELIISVDGDKQTHEKLRKGADYDTIIDNLELFTFLKDVFPIVRLQAIGHFIGEEKTKKFIEEWIEKVDVVYIKNLEVMPALGNKNLGQMEINKRLKIRKPCKQLYFVLTVTSNGEICYCCHDPQGKTSLGNIKEKSLSTAWVQMSEMRENHRKGIYTELCSVCPDHSW